MSGIEWLDTTPTKKRRKLQLPSTPSPQSRRKKKAERTTKPVKYQVEEASAIQGQNDAKEGETPAEEHQEESTRLAF